MTAPQFLIIVILAAALLAFGLNYILENRPEPQRPRSAGEAAPSEKPADPERSARQKRRDFFTRLMFIFWTVCLVAHRAWIIYLALALDASSSSDAKGALGMGIAMFDPLGILVVLGGSLAFKGVTGLDLWPEKDLSTLYMGGTIVMDSLIIYFLWRCSRHAFIKTEKEERKTEAK